MARGRRDYFTPDYDSTMKVAESRGLGYDSMYKDTAKLLKPKKGVNIVRALPPTWRDPVHYAYRMYYHANIGPNDRRYLCPLTKYNPTSPYDRCPVCQTLYELGSSATQEDKNELRPRLTYLIYLIDRDNEKEGVQLWSTGHKNITELAIQSIDRRNKAVLNITHPDKGYDFEFTRVGTGRNDTRYHGFMVSRESTPLSDSDKRYNQWLDYAFEHPIPELLEFYKPSRIEEEFYGKSKKDEDDEDDDRSTRSRRRTSADDDDDDEPRRPLRRTRAEETDDDDDKEEARPSRRRPSRVDDDESKARRRRSPADDDDEDEKPARRRARPADDDEEERPARVRAGREPREPDDDEDEKPTRRRRPAADDDEDEPKPRARSRSDDDDEEEERPARRSRARPSDDDEDEPKPRRPRRSALAEEIDDELPSDSRRRRANGADDEDPAPRRSRQRLEDDDEEEKPARSRRAKPADDDDEEEGSRHERSRSRLRERLDRS